MLGIRFNAINNFSEVDMQKSELQEKIYSQIEELPTLPAVIPRLLSLLRDSKSCAQDVTEIISKDPALTSKILKVANSAYYGFQQKISELDRAVALLGFNMVKTLALSISVIQVLPGIKKSPYFTQEGLWHHSLGVATVITEIGRKYAKEKDTESLFIIGLLHDIGKVVFDQFFHEDFHLALEKANTEGIKLHDAEKIIIGIDHCETAAMLLKRWNFPERIINAVEYHHSEDIPEKVRGRDVAMLRIANSLTQEQKMGKEGNSVSNEIKEEDLELLGFASSNIDDLKKYMHENQDVIYSFFSVLI